MCLRAIWGERQLAGCWDFNIRDHIKALELRALLLAILALPWKDHFFPV